MRSKSALVLFCSTLLSLISPSCSGYEESLDSYEPTPQELDEIYRRENVRLTIANVASEKTPAEIAAQAWSGVCFAQFQAQVHSGASQSSCTFALLNESSAVPTDCNAQLCRAWTAGCVAHQLLDLASLPTAVDLAGGWNVPPQSTETRAALAREAAIHVRESIYWSWRGLSTEAIDSAATGTCNSQFANTTLTGSASTARALGETYATTFLDAYDLIFESARTATRHMSGVAQSQMASTSDDVRADARSQSYPLISSAAIGHLLFGGSGVSGGTRYGDGLAGDTSPLCSQPALSPDGASALITLQSLGLRPSDLLDQGTSIDGLVAGSVAEGNIRDRLADFTTYSPLEDMSADEVYGFLHLRRDDFVEAREYAVAQHRAFDRSTETSTSVLGRALPSDRRPDGAAPGFLRYASTSQSPRQLPRGYFGLRLRDPDLTSAPTVESQLDDRPSTFTDQTAPVPATDVNNFAAESLANLVDYAATLAYGLNSASGWNTSGPTGSALPRNLIAYAANEMRFDRESRTELSYRHSSASKETVRVRFYSYLPTSTASQTIIVRSTDGLRCATEGSVEGARCRLSDYQWLSTPASTCTGASTSQGLPSCFQWTPGELSFTTPNPRFFIVQPRTGASSGPGSYRVVGSFTITTLGTISSTWQYCDIAPYVGEFETLADAAMRRDPNGCRDPAQSCTDLLADFDLPLEDELISDSDSYEDSWRHYLDMAGAAAEHADRLADEVIANGLANDERAEVAANRLEDLCGVNVSLDGLFDPALTASVGGTCTTDANCTAPQRCYGNRCVLDPYEYIMSLSTIPESDRARLQRCLGDEVYPLVNLGTTPSCVWYPNGDRTSMCEPVGAVDQAWERAPCPWRATRDPATGDFDCGSPDAATFPTGTHTIAATDASVGLFDAEGNGEGANPPCQDLRRLRRPGDYGLDADARRAALGRVLASGFFEVNRVQELAGRIGYVARAGNFARVRFDGRDWFSTGDYRTPVPAPSSAPWPCGAQLDTSIGCDVDDTTSLFCARASDCRTVDAANVPTERYALNQRYMRAVLVARMTSGAGMSQVVLPWTWNLSSSFGGAESRFVDIFHEQMSSDFASRVLWTSQRDALYWRGPANFWYARDTVAGFDRFVCTASGSPEVPIWGSVTSNCVVPSDGGVRHPAFYVGFVAPRFGIDSSRLIETDIYWSGLGGTASMRFSDDSAVPIFSPLLDRLAAGTFDESAVAPRGVHDLVFQPNDNGIFQDGFVNIDSAWEEGRNVRYGNVAATQDLGPTTDGHLLDALELVCEAGRVEQAGCDPTRPPLIESVEDLPAARSFLRCLANTIEQRASTTVFAQMPIRAVDAVRDSFSSRTFPQVGGAYSGQITRLGDSMNQLRSGAMALATELRHFEENLGRLQGALRVNELQSRRIDLELMGTMNSQMGSCAQGLLTNFYGGIAGCASSIAGIPVAREVSGIQQEELNLAAGQSVDDFASTFTDQAEALGHAATAISTGYAGIQSALADMETTRAAARRELSRAVLADTDAMGRHNPVNTVYRRRYTTSVTRYEEALLNARRLAHLARRAIEQRFAIDLRTLDGTSRDLGLVEAPSEWIDDVCLMGGIDYTRIRSGETPITNYADGYIGDYVRRLNLLVEGYRLAYPFEDTTDVTVLSLRDEIRGVRRECSVDEVPRRNLLAYGGDIGHRAATADDPGWQATSCAVDSGGQPLPDCVAVTLSSYPGPDLDTPVHPDGLNPRITAFDVQFGTASGTSGHTISTRLGQTVLLPPGRYRLSWYGDWPHSEGGLDPWSAVRVVGATVTPTVIQAAPIGWERYHMILTVSGSGSATVPVSIAVGPSSASPGRMVVAGFMLEDVSDTVRTSPSVATAWPPPHFWPSPEEDLPTGLALCEDTTGEEFRSPGVWRRDCVQLCPGGYGGSCDTSGRGSDELTRYCFWETSFTITQSAIEESRIVRPGGLAIGNFNYRVDSIALNFVGTGTRECADDRLPSTCHAAGYIPYTLDHFGPYPVRNHMGGLYNAPITTGHIEHGRGLAAERYITNPMSTSDRALLGDYTHMEFRGRPLTGNYRLRVWDVEGVNFSGIEDIQIALGYRYWTRFE